MTDAPLAVPGAAPVPFSIKIFAFLFCPLLIAFDVMQFWKLSQLAHAQTDGSLMIVHLLIITLATSALVVFASLAAFQYGEHLSQKNASVREAGLSKRVGYHEELLRLITDNIPNMLFIADREGRFWFANREVADQGRTTSREIVGKTIDRVFPMRQATLLLERIRRAQSAYAPVITVDRHDDASGPHYMQTYHTPLPDTAELHKMVMVTQKDITDVIVERERQEETFRQLLDTLIAVVDRRDPYAAGHSIRVGMLSEALGQQLGLDEQNIEACHIAGSLMNIGKIQVPRSILVKTTALTQEELALVRKSILASADILSLISFQIPVIPTLRQVLERYDGQGIPERRKGEGIIFPARIVAVANAFIALVSPRAHRAGLSIGEAISRLKLDANSVYDPRVIDALDIYLQKNTSVRDSLTKPPPELHKIGLDADIHND
jgi:PAS domain S-box-containing protein